MDEKSTVLMNRAAAVLNDIFWSDHVCGEITLSKDEDYGRTKISFKSRTSHVKCDFSSMEIYICAKTFTKNYLGNFFLRFTL